MDLITKEQFVEIINAHIKFDKEVDELNAKHIDVIESILFQHAALMFDRFMERVFNEDGCDWIYYYLYEMPENPKITDKDGNSIPLNNLDDLWELVKDYRI